MFCFMFLLLGVCLAGRYEPFPFEAMDHKCQGSSGTCPDDSTCCELGPDDTICCRNTTVPSSTCCSDGCCLDAEECCADSKGASCCVQQTTFCVSEAYPYPARCCPRWTVGCSVGSVGCCDPAQPWQWVLQAPSGQRLGQSPVAPMHQNRDMKSSKDDDLLTARGVDDDVQVVYALFEATFGLEVFHLDPSTGAVVNKVRVQELDDNTASESTREFLFDEEHKSFYYLDANFTANGGIRPSTGRPVYLYSINAVTGAQTKLVVSGATDYPTGQALCNGLIIVACEGFTGSKVTGFNYYSLDPKTGTATSLGSIDRGSTEGDDGFYAGYHRACGSDNKVYRLGYKKVTMQQEQGIDIVTLSGPTTSAKWQDELSPDHDYYMSIDSFKDQFISLAPSLNSTSRGLDVVQWGLDGSAPRVVASLGNAHPPRVAQLGVLGYMGTYYSAAQGIYTAMVVQQSASPLFDSWAIAVLDVASGTANISPISPRLLAGSNGLSGLGFA